MHAPKPCPLSSSIVISSCGNSLPDNRHRKENLRHTSQVTHNEDNPTAKKMRTAPRKPLPAISVTTEKSAAPAVPDATGDGERRPGRRFPTGSPPPPPERAILPRDIASTPPEPAAGVPPPTQAHRSNAIHHNHPQAREQGAPHKLPTKPCTIPRRYLQLLQMTRLKTQDSGT